MIQSRPKTPNGDPDVPKLTYTLGGTDRWFVRHRFRAQGRLRVGENVELDHENKPTLTVMVTAKDAHGERDTIRVTIRVTDVDEKPTISERGETATDQVKSVGYMENGRSAVITLVAEDPEGADIVWSLLEVAAVAECSGP